MKITLQQKVEALIFASTQRITTREILEIIKLDEKDDFSIQDIETAIHQLEKKYQSDEFSFSLQRINEGYLFLSKAAYYSLLNKLKSHHEKKRLSQAALETLSIIAYRQPITKLEVEQIRGVNSDYSIQRLLDRGLVKILGKSDSLGRPLLYGISDEFMDYFGINSTRDLPKTKDIMKKENIIGNPED